MISIFGDEGSSAALATYGLVAIADADLPRLDAVFLQARTTLGNPASTEPLHCKVLFHNDRRAQSDYSGARRKDVEAACSTLIWQVSTLATRFYFGKVARHAAPKVLDAPLQDPKQPGKTVPFRMRLELVHLQIFAYAAATTRACHMLSASGPKQVFIDRVSTVIRWSNENRQAWRAMQQLLISTELGDWPEAQPISSRDNLGLQLANIFTYHLTKAQSDPRFATRLAPLASKVEELRYEFAGS